jgi:hypothetical protein
MPKIIKDYVAAMPMTAVVLSMLAGEFVRPASKIRELFERFGGGY